MEQKLRLEWLDPKTLKPNPKNYRLHPEQQKKILSAVMGEVGWAGALLYNDQTGNLIDGHARQEEAIAKGDKSVPVLVGSWSEEDERKILATLDPIAGMADQADAIYQELLKGIDTENEDLQGWVDALLGELADTPEGTQGLTDPDEVPPEPEKPVSVTGDLWVMGNHRLICGDSTSSDVVGKLLSQVKPLLMVTDPPYGVEYDPDWRNRADRANGKPYGARAIGQVMNDGKADWREAWSLFPGDVAYVWHAGRHASSVQASLEACDFDIRCQIIWAKNNFAISRGDYHWQHEPCWYAVKKSGKGHWAGDRSQTTLWKIDKPRKSETGHSTQKPVECMRRPIENNSSPGQAVYEPFSGSGTTIIAAEQTGRCCYAIELNHSYVDMAVIRWQNFTGKQAILEGDGRTFEEVKNARH